MPWDLPAYHNFKYLILFYNYRDEDEGMLNGYSIMAFVNEAYANDVLMSSDSWNLRG